MIHNSADLRLKILEIQVLLSKNRSDADSFAWKYSQISEAFSVHENTVIGVRKRFVEDGLEAALDRKRQTNPSHQQTFDGKREARLIALSCSELPEEHSRWTLRLLADKAVELEIVESVFHETVRQTLKKRTEASFAKKLGNSTRAKWRICSKDGRCR
ncbi:MAG: helix-turn-helix domain-containing protein [Desulfobacterales bacterium]|nr:helix-turn-helix domain-containing protein [Desulfobacterales bacterium]